MKCLHCYGYLVSFICMGTSSYHFSPQETCLQLGEISVASIAERFQKRVIQLSYRGCQFPIEIADYREEVDLKMSAALKEAAAGMTGGLSCLKCESAILGEVVVGVSKVPAEYITSFESARAAANAMLSLHQCDSGAEILTLLTKKTAFYLQLDRSFVVELGLVRSMCEAGGSHRLQTLVMALMPTAVRRTTLAEVAAGMHRLQQSELFAFVSESSRGTFDAAKEVINNLERGIGPRLSPEADSFIGILLARPAYW
jgi:hypothetical protein